MEKPSLSEVKVSVVDDETEVGVAVGVLVGIFVGVSVGALVGVTVVLVTVGVILPETEATGVTIEAEVEAGVTSLVSSSGESVGNNSILGVVSEV